MTRIIKSGKPQAGTKKAKAFKFFDQGFGVSCDELKGLKLKGGTRYVYHDEWKKLRGIKDDEVQIPGSTDIVLSPEDQQFDNIGKDDTVVIGDQEGEGKVNAAIIDDTVPKVSKEDDGNGASLPNMPNLDLPPDDPHIPDVVLGFGIPFKVSLTVKSVSFYQMAATSAGGMNKLSLSNFIDQCIEDFFTGRGKDIGIVQLGGANGSPNG